MIPWLLPSTHHPLPLCGDRYKKHRIGFSTNISQEFEDKQLYQPITRKKLCFINYTFLFFSINAALIISRFRIVLYAVSS